VLPGRRLAIFVDGDYWHSCPIHGRQTPFLGPNAELWEQKMQRNKERDIYASNTAADLGWKPVRVWECSVRADAAAVAAAILADHPVPPVNCSS
jgi:DNA mismatch endonuclease (patch repair protein)